MNPMGLFLVAFGGFALCGAGFNWDWFMMHRKARFMTAILTRTGARIFYALLGIALIVFGVLVALGIVEETR